MIWTLAVNVAEYVQPLITPPFRRYSLSDSGATVQVSGRGCIFGGQDVSAAAICLGYHRAGTLTGCGVDTAAGGSKSSPGGDDFVCKRSMGGPHRNKLRSAECRQISGFVGECPEEYKDQHLQLLPPLQNPRLIDAASWSRFVTHLQDTNLAFVESIETQYISTKTLKLNEVIRKGPILQRCRALESINMPSMGEDAFEWVVKERRLYNVQSVAAGIHS
ncbi:MAG: hypothetical protein J3R72DRAFT_31964 [Linnemannia gamsii]|nr:MAG: hypothetical protein J3R72DRAFT_31964 [Linnemannia gamsii]